MRLIFIVFLLSCHTISVAEVFTKWTDPDGQVHYGDDWTVASPATESRLVIYDTFDEESYRAALRRHAEDEKERRAREKKHRNKTKKANKARRSGRQRPLNDAEKYERYLEQQEKKKQQELQRKRERRKEVRQRWNLNCNDSRYAGTRACR